MAKHGHYSLCGFFPYYPNTYNPKHYLYWLHWFNVADMWRAVKYFWQRGTRGYAKCDHWNAESYFEYIMIGVLTDLKNCSHGYPAGICTCTWSNTEYKCIPKGEVCDGMIKWQELLQVMIDGLDASLDLKEENTVPEGVYPDYEK
jgi:hypothetical protein